MEIYGITCYIEIKIKNMNIKKAIEKEDSKEYRFVIIKDNDHQYFDLKKNIKMKKFKKLKKKSNQTSKK